VSASDARAAPLPHGPDTIARRWICGRLFAQAPFGICVIDRSYRILDANPRFTSTWGPARGRRCYSVYKRRRARCDQCGAAEAFRDGKTRVREEEGLDREDRQHHYMVHILPVTDRSGRVVAAVEISTDITEFKRLEAEKLQAERLAALGQTAAGLAHGIKNIIMGLEGGLYVVGSGIQSRNDERIQRGWSMLEDNIGRISSFAKEFLSFARGTPPRISEVDPNAVAAKVTGLFAEKAGTAGIALRFEPQAGIARAPMDESGLHTCLSNLISNALDACEVSEKPSPEVTLLTREQNGMIVFEVKDNARGIDSEIRQKVFTTFCSTKATGKGTGLGLLTTRRIVQDHGGSVAFESTPDEGSVFRLSFPRTRPRRERAHAEAASGGPSPERRDVPETPGGTKHGKPARQAGPGGRGRAGRAALPAGRPRGRGLPGGERRRRR
jgi:signal transduction histidine kinase